MFLYSLTSSVEYRNYLEREREREREREAMVVTTATALPLLSCVAERGNRDADEV